MGKVLGLVLGCLPGVAAGGAWTFIFPGVGLALGWFYDRNTGFQDPDDPALHDAAATREELDREANRVFARYLAALFVIVAQTDGEITAANAAVIRSFFQDNLGFDPGELELVRTLIQEARRAGPGLRLSCAATREALNPAERSLLVYALWEMATADGPASPRTAQVLEEIGRELQLDPDLLAAMRHTRLVEPRGAGEGGAPEPAEVPVGPSPWERLGISPDASEAEIKRCWRELAHKLHPDKVAHLGPQAMELAGRAFAEVSAAYDEIRRERGIS